MNNVNTQYVGALGEDIGCRFLVKRGYSIIERNYRKKYGEIDIVARKSGTVSFVEVKSVFRKFDSLDAFHPEENVHHEKLRRLSRVIQVYISEHNMENNLWKFGVLCVFIDSVSHEARVRYFEDALKL